MNRLIYIFVLMILLSCESKTNYKPPEDLISKEEMINLLVDMHLATASTGIVNVDDVRKRNYMTVVYQKYKIDSARFAESNFYYTSRIEEYEIIFKEVEVRLREIQQRYKKVDSTKNIDYFDSEEKLRQKIGKDDIVK